MSNEQNNDSGRLVVPDVPLASKATMADVRLKVFAWGEPGTGKSRLGLSFPKPLVADLENSTGLYAGEFDFLRATRQVTLADGARYDYKPHQLVYALVQQIKKGLYPGVETLVIDPITDYMDALEAALIEKMAAKGVNIATMSGMAKAKAYSELNDAIRGELEKLLALPLHVVFVCRAKNLWGTNAQGKMDVIGRQPDCKEIVPYLADVVLRMERGGAAVVEKGRLAALPGKIQAISFADIQAAITAAQAEPPAPAPEAAPSKSKRQRTGDPMVDAVLEAEEAEGVPA